MDNLVIARAAFKRKSGTELDGFERSQLRLYQYYNFRIFENIYIQHKQGLFSDQEWDRFRTIIKRVLNKDEIALDMWNDKQGDWTEEFQTEVTDILSEK